MTIDEAIDYNKRIASDYRERSEMLDDSKAVFMCIEKSDNHEHIAEWLEELKDCRDKNKLVVRIDCENIDKVKEGMKELQELKDTKIPELIKQIEFEEKWLHDAYVENGYRHNPSDVNIAFKSIRRMVNKLLRE